jgi:hypothetical protein
MNNFVRFASDYNLELSENEIRSYQNMLNAHQYTQIYPFLGSFREFIEDEIAFRLETLADLFREPIRSSILTNIDAYIDLEGEEEVEEVRQSLALFLGQVSMMLQYRYLAPGITSIAASREYVEYRDVLLRLLDFYLMALRRLRHLTAAPAA